MTHGSAPTILDVCDAQGWPWPVSHADGVAFFRRCLARGIATNVDECPTRAEAAGGPCPYAATIGHGTPDPRWQERGTA